eukprot:CAMPEP_0118647246 /NCGR_PEP_ID=MMETSP0785-20121206/8503_1 /TAXON_ID=91992 /ORGANISM="Bolidomonas pacifica, Strain CCMP 1866" /LENGTH=61 /DNA_ID=CAMNT_0006539325 /DNA_START=130 /DNA_END=311 /DNA_ORIENTATION=+
MPKGSKRDIDGIVMVEGRLKLEEDSETEGGQANVKAGPQNSSQGRTKPTLSVADLTEEDWV